MSKKIKWKRVVKNKRVSGLVFEIVLEEEV
jgi:hypothetical protein